MYGSAPSTILTRGAGLLCIAPDELWEIHSNVGRRLQNKIEEPQKRVWFVYSYLFERFNLRDYVYSILSIV